MPSATTSFDITNDIKMPSNLARGEGPSIRHCPGLLMTRRPGRCRLRYIGRALPDVRENPLQRLTGTDRLVEDNLAECTPAVSIAIPGGYCVDRYFRGQRLGPMPSRCLIQREFVAIRASHTAMIGLQTREHLAIDLGVQNALDDHVQTMLERESRGQIHVRDAQSFRMITDV